ncbi:MAG: DNA oxidative demethylase AlkB [Moraxellaceae bacterium]|nr:MAG: DNA oxidative demethylase AlkB [Moraxellaceae bacterium]
MMNLDLFDTLPAGLEKIGEQSVVLRQFASPMQDELMAAIDQISRQAPFRHMLTPGGYTMSAAMTSCGSLGWITDRKGYRYQSVDPLTGKRWPDMPHVFQALAQQAASMAGFEHFQPDSCLINVYGVGAKMSLHQDKNEKDMTQPVVSVSLGITATFLFGGLQRKDNTQKIVLQHGDVVVWGGVDRLRYHGILSLKPASHLLLGERRINVTFRQAG